MAHTITLRNFIFRYFFLMAVVFFVLSYKPFLDIFDLNRVYSEVVVFFTSIALDLINLPYSCTGILIHLPNLSLKVEFGCNGLEAVFIYSAGVLAYPASFKSKIVGVAAGFFVIQLFNIVRIAVLAYSAVYYKELFDIIHIYVAQGIMIAASLAIFIVYLNWQNEDSTEC